MVLVMELEVYCVYMKDLLEYQRERWFNWRKECVYQMNQDIMKMENLVLELKMLLWFNNIQSIKID